jgi:Zn-dependent M16 (insulinase) family peptidase
MLILGSCFSKQDFYNLVDVYLDAVFFPKCVEDHHTFQQEGWHLELNNPSEEISYKGCIFKKYTQLLVWQYYSLFCI